jgi:F0F1-type ATP synthase assembly protein I
METIGAILFLIGVIISIVYGIILLIRAFQAGILWGLGYLLIPFVGLIFVVVHWEDAKSPFLKGLLAIPFIIAGILLMPDSSPPI